LVGCVAGADPKDVTKTTNIVLKDDETLKAVIAVCGCWLAHSSCMLVVEMGHVGYLQAHWPYSDSVVLHYSRA
jgi:hypothetical protein